MRYPPEVIKHAAIVLQKVGAAWTAGGEGSMEMSYATNDDMPFGTCNVGYNRWKNNSEDTGPVITVRHANMTIADSVKLLEEMQKVIPTEIARLKKLETDDKGTAAVSREIEEADAATE